MKKSLLVAAMLGVSLSGALTVGVISAKADTAIWRLYNSNTGEHFYTKSSTERDADYNAGWNIEGTGWKAPDTGIPVYRLYNPFSHNAGSHYYTASHYEAKTLVAKGWHWDNNGKPVFYSGGSLLVYVAYNWHNSGHNYSTSLNEQNSLINAGWSANAVTFHAKGAGNSNGSKIHPIPASKVVAIAESYQGQNMVCDELVAKAYLAAGYPALPLSFFGLANGHAYNMPALEYKQVSLNALQPGDILLYGGGSIYYWNGAPYWSGDEHASIYIGNGKAINGGMNDGKQVGIYPLYLDVQGSWQNPYAAYRVTGANPNF